MHTVKRLSGLLAALVLSLPVWSQSATNNPPLSLAVDLTDGSHLVGVPAINSIRLQTPYALVDIPLVQTRSITLEKDRESAVFEMKNGDRIKGAMLLKKLDLQTAFGKVTIGAEQIVNIDIMPGGRMPEVLLKALTLYYSFDKDESDFVADLSGKGNNGKLHGTEWMPMGKVGGARTFNGTCDYISVEYEDTHKTGLFPTQAPLSIAAWFKTSAEAPKHQPVLSTHYNGAGRDGYHLRVDSRDYGGKVYWVASVEGGTCAVSQRAVNDGQWHHAAGVWDGKQNTLYLDGILQAAVPAAGSLVYQHRAPFQIGHASNNNAAHARDEFYYFKGILDEVMVFDRALSAEEVNVLINACN